MKKYIFLKSLFSTKYYQAKTSVPMQIFYLRQRITYTIKLEANIKTLYKNHIREQYM